MRYYKYKCTSCGSTVFDKVENGYKCKYCGCIQDVILTKDENSDSDKTKERTEDLKLKAESETTLKEEPSKKTKMTPKVQSSLLKLILCVLGGWFGLHKFLKGEIFWGIVYAVTGGIFGIGYAIDIIGGVLDLANSIRSGSEE